MNTGICDQCRVTDRCRLMSTPFKNHIYTWLEHQTFPWKTVMLIWMWQISDKLNSYSTNSQQQPPQGALHCNITRIKGIVLHYIIKTMAASIPASKNVLVVRSAVNKTLDSSRHMLQNVCCSVFIITLRTFLVHVWAEVFRDSKSPQSSAWQAIWCEHPTLPGWGLGWHDI